MSTLLNILRAQQDPQLRARADLFTQRIKQNRMQSECLMLRAKLWERVRSLREGARHQGSLKSGPLPLGASRKYPGNQFDRQCSADSRSSGLRIGLSSSLSEGSHRLCIASAPLPHSDTETDL